MLNLFPYLLEWYPRSVDAHCLTEEETIVFTLLNDSTFSLVHFILFGNLSSGTYAYRNSVFEAYNPYSPPWLT